MSLCKTFYKTFSAKEKLSSLKRAHGWFFCVYLSYCTWFCFSLVYSCHSVLWFIMLVLTRMLSYSRLKTSFLSFYPENASLSFFLNYFAVLYVHTWHWRLVGSGA